VIISLVFYAKINTQDNLLDDTVIAGKPEGRWRTGRQQEGLQYNEEAAWGKIIVIYIVGITAAWPH
jgi:hypothetical protein